jgi:pimeloyl-ACP methyl ester carboxylesterase
MNTLTPIHFPADSLTVHRDIGTGRTFVVVVDDAHYSDVALAVTERLSLRARAVLVTSSPITVDSWGTLSTRLGDVLQGLGVRQASLIGCGAGATLAQNLALSDPKFVRSLVVVDATGRPHPTRWERLVDAVESKLPFGLPLRLGSSGFNVKSYVHRLRSPLLIVSTHRAGSFIRDELESLARMAPTAWLVDISEHTGEAEIATLCDTVEAFQDTPVKCPQKNLRGAA